MSNFTRRSRTTSNFTIVDGIAYITDPTRGKTLSIARQTFQFGHDSASSQYLRLSEINNPGIGTGYEIENDATIVAFGAHARTGNTSKTFEIRRNNVATSIFTFSFPGVAAPNISTGSDTTNVNLDAGDHLQLFVTAAGTPTRDVAIWVQIAWRI